jgi:hypothetical protein
VPAPFHSGWRSAERPGTPLSGLTLADWHDFKLGRSLAGRLLQKSSVIGLH